MTLDERSDRVKTREDLVKFIQELHQDLLKRPREWENDTLDRFLKAMAAWVNDANGYYANQGLPVPEQPTWSTIAGILVAAKIYE